MYSEFYLGAVKWRILYVDIIEGEYFGLCENSFCKITIATKVLSSSDKLEIPQDLIDNTLFHEIQHAIMFSLGITDSDELTHNEKTVQSISNMWHQVFKTIK